MCLRVVPNGSQLITAGEMWTLVFIFFVGIFSRALRQHKNRIHGLGDLPWTHGRVTSMTFVRLGQAEFWCSPCDLPGSGQRGQRWVALSPTGCLPAGDSNSRFLSRLQTLNAPRLQDQRCPRNIVYITLTRRHSGGTWKLSIGPS